MDSITRAIAEQLSQRLGQPVVIENKPGGGMVIGSNAVASARADGYTLMNAPSGAYVINPTLYKKLPYDPQTGFVPVSLYARIPFVLVVNPCAAGQFGEGADPVFQGQSGQAVVRGEHDRRA